MITLDYNLSPSSPELRGALDLEVANEHDLRYDAFLGDIVFRAGSTDFSTRWGWVPVLDFALALERLASQLKRGEPAAVFEFTENDDVIRFERDEQEVMLSATYTPYRTVVDVDELTSTATKFRRRIVEDLSERHPRLRTNVNMRALVEGV